MRQSMTEGLAAGAMGGELSGASWRDYYELCKPKVVALIVFTAVVGMFLATNPAGMVAPDVLIFATLGIGLAAASAAAINHVVDHEVDQRMARTRRRPCSTRRG